MTDTLTGTPAWQALARHHPTVADLHLRDLFATDGARVERLTFEAAGINADLSKHRVTAESVALLLALAAERRVTERRDAMFRGEHVNTTEDRPALHVALRMPKERSLVVDGRDVVREVHEVLDRMAAFAAGVRSGEWRGHTGRPVRAVVNVGIGGSDLGPAMAYEALRAFSDRGLAFRFVSNVDGSDLLEALRDLDPEETLMIVSSKTFTTLETMTNAAEHPRLAPRRARRRRGRDRQARGGGLDEPRVRSRSSGSIPRTRSGSGTGSAGATRWTLPSAFRR